jgi:hypothetical protein
MNIFVEVAGNEPFGCCEVVPPVAVWGGAGCGVGVWLYRSSASGSSGYHNHDLLNRLFLWYYSWRSNGVCRLR